ncbi:MAG: hypothetical protein EZS28_023621 [Streblomastix strix]|uniref:Uncharacterized protein n=1 Tax=Streblomastix strix TaxID=222440 RepID=A0A5J4VEH4_9EUKA|nr:MAG: hypothetical protein EZS28_023621 [Streblomastix strix]
MNDYNVSNLGIDLSKEYFNVNEAEYGKSLYVETDKLNELFLQIFNLDQGYYLRGDYDDNSPEFQLQGLNLTLTAFNQLSTISDIQQYQQYLRRYWTESILLQITIADAVIECYNKLWYYYYRDSKLQGRDIYGYGWRDDACRTFEIGLQEVSLGIGGNETALIENKTIMISDNTNGYDQKFKCGDTTLEDNFKEWIHIQNGMNESLQGITLTSDESIFIPAIYISDQNTTVKLEEFIIYDITFQPQIPYSTGPRGVIQIDFSDKDVQILNCKIENIIIDSLEGSALRIQNFTDTPPIIPPLILPLPHPEPDTSINITINST